MHRIRPRTWALYLLHSMFPEFVLASCPRLVAALRCTGSSFHKISLRRQGCIYAYQAITSAAQQEIEVKAYGATRRTKGLLLDPGDAGDGDWNQSQPGSQNSAPQDHFLGSKLPGSRNGFQMILPDAASGAYRWIGRGAYLSRMSWRHVGSSPCIERQRGGRVEQSAPPWSYDCAA